MINIPAKCVGCPELAKLVEEKDSASNTLETMAGMLGIPVDELRSTILNQGLDATEALSGIPNRMIEETNTLLIDAYHNRPWAQKMTFGQYLDEAYETKEPAQFQTLIEVSPWKTGFEIPFDIAIGMFHAGNEAMKAEIKAQGGDSTQQKLSDVTTRTYDFANDMTAQVDSLNSQIESTVEGCEAGVQSEKKFFKTRLACGSTALRSS